MKTLVILYVADQAKSKAFYTTVLGTSPVLDVPGMTEFKFEGNFSLCLMPERGIKGLLGEKLPDPAKGNGIPRAELYMLVDDPGAYHARALKAGAVEVKPLGQMPWGDTVAYSMDPDGNVLAFGKSS
ncbi:MAG: VOC family protein [Elusimicrobia bacterium]|nr:VOC family protein [Elusimicrobiota bacterium]